MLWAASWPAGSTTSSQSPSGHRAKVREFESKRISDFCPRLHISFIRLHQNSGDTSADCRNSGPIRYDSLTFARSPVDWAQSAPRRRRAQVLNEQQGQIKGLVNFLIFNLVELN